jgi:hypothetical protein
MNIHERMDETTWAAVDGSSVHYDGVEGSVKVVMGFRHHLLLH